jgi:putative endonuclease
MNKRAQGGFYEKLACDYLVSKGCDILSVNFRSRCGEIDIIARDGKYTCFIEVKFRKDFSYGSPEAAVNISKQRQICKVSKFFLYSRKKSFDIPIRYDVIAISGEDMEYTFHWIKNAFNYIG